MQRPSYIPRMRYKRPFGPARIDPFVGLPPEALTINGTTVTPSFRYVGAGAGASAFAPYEYGAALALAGSGTDPALNQPCPLRGRIVRDRAVQFQVGKYYEASENTTGDIAAEDFVLEVVWKKTDSTNRRLLAKRASEGYFVSTAAGISLFLDGATTTATIASAGVADGTWFHALFFVDVSGSGQCYVNGAASGAAAAVSAVGTIAVASPLRLGSDGTAHWSGHLGYLAMWQSSDWLDTHLQATVAAARYAALGMALA